MTLARCRTAEEVAHVLRRVYGLPAHVAFGRPMVTTGPRLGAVTVRRDLGHQVLTAAESDALMPIIAEPRGRRWTFLVDPADILSATTIALFAMDEVWVAGDGHTIMMPMSNSAVSYRWVNQPAPGSLRLPTRTVVLEAAASALAQSRGTVTP